MSSCDSCGSDRILELNAKCSDRCHTVFKGVSKSDYPPKVSGICGSDYVFPDICLECGKAQGSFPLEDPEGFERLSCNVCDQEPSHSLDAYEGQACKVKGCLGYLVFVD